MENEVQKIENKNREGYILPASILIAAIIIGGTLIYTTSSRRTIEQKQTSVLTSALTGALTGNNGEVEIDENLVIPSEGVKLSVVWNDLGAKMVEAGVIDSQKFEAIYVQRGGLDEEMKKILYGKDNGEIKITPQNSGFLLNIFWALGLGNKNQILEEGPMSDSRYGGAGNFASTGGWTLAKGDTMTHYSKYKFINLAPEQQALVERVSQGIYRPCCGNSTYFPDCNHGMAMLGLLELMASQGVSEKEIYKKALLVNSYWFPDTYLTIAKYLQVKKGISFDKADPKEILGFDYSSGSGYQAILQEVRPAERQGGGGCGA